MSEIWLMIRSTLCGLAVVSVIAVAVACGSKQKPAETAENSDKEASDGGASDQASDAGVGGEGGSKASVCTGFEMDLMEALGQSACEVPNPKPDDKPMDVKGKLDVKVMSMGNTVVPGGHAELVVTFTNKSAQPLPLMFTIDPLPRFQVEAYRAKDNTRVDEPKGNTPPIPDGLNRTPTEPSTAKITLAANGKASVHVGWDASKMRWAPEKLRGTPPEQGYPKAPDKPLPKGKYVLRVITPLVGVFEGVDHEISSPRTDIEVRN